MEAGIFSGGSWHCRDSDGFGGRSIADAAGDDSGNTCRRKSGFGVCISGDTAAGLIPTGEKGREMADFSPSGSGGDLVAVLCGAGISHATGGTGIGGIFKWSSRDWAGIWLRYPDQN